VIDLRRDGEVFVLRFDAGENRIHPEFLAALNGALDEVEASQGPAALVTTGAGKFYSNGLDVAGLAGLGGEALRAFLAELDRVFARVLSLPVASVAAINGHAFAAGGMLALAHDFRVMRADRGFFCLPEIDMAMGQPLEPGMYAVIGAALPRPIFHEALITGRRYGGLDAAARGIVTEAVAEAEVLPRALGIARGMAGKDRETLRQLKRGLHADALAVLERHGQGSGSGRAKEPD
jgi:enoyl-CoA hydratase/carnithine racemase